MRMTAPQSIDAGAGTGHPRCRDGDGCRCARDAVDSCRGMTTVDLPVYCFTNVGRMKL